MQHPRGITDPAGLQGPINDLSLDVRRVSSVGLLQEKHPAATRARPAPITWVTRRRRAMSHNIRALAGGPEEHLRCHSCSLAHG
jgi:hypothetical protein